MESLSVSTWNIKGGFSRPDVALPIVKELATSNADIITLPDTWREDSIHSTPTNRQRLISDADLQEHGYAALTSIVDTPVRPDDNYALYGYTTLYKNTLEPLETHEIRLGERPAHHLALQLGQHSLNLISLYFTDISEARRLKQVDDLLAYAETLKDSPLVLTGDFNALHKDDRSARILRAAPISAILSTIHIKNQLAPRLVEMATGTTLERLENAGFIDLDPTHTPSMPGILPLFQLDRVMAKDGATTEVIAVDTTIHQKTPLSDHRRLSTTLQLK